MAELTIAEHVAEIADAEGIDFDKCHAEFPHDSMPHADDRGARHVFADGSSISSDGCAWWVDSPASQEG